MLWLDMMTCSPSVLHIMFIVARCLDFTDILALEINVLYTYDTYFGSKIPSDSISEHLFLTGGHACTP